MIVELNETELMEVNGGLFFIPLLIAGFSTGFGGVSSGALIAAGAAGAAAVTIAFTKDQA